MSNDTIFVQFSADKLTQLSTRIIDCLARLSPEQIWMRGGDHENAIGNLVLHLCGNVRQWIGSGVGGQADVRMRDAEFAARGGLEAAELRERLTAVVAGAAEIIRTLPAGRLTERIRVQGYDVSVLEAIYHVVEHFSGHTGQIIFATKLLTGDDLGFYRHISQPAHAERVP
jgi:uncharacterized damage-inducible protein DinB